MAGWKARDSRSMRTATSTSYTPERPVRSDSPVSYPPSEYAWVVHANPGKHPLVRSITKALVNGAPC